MDREQLKKKVGQRMVEVRTQKGWSQSDLARAYPKDRQAIEKLERKGKPNYLFAVRNCPSVGGRVKGFGFFLS